MSTGKPDDPTIPSEAACKREIEQLHDFFVEWYAGELDEGEFARMERAMGEGFEMVTPEGDRLDREEVLEMVRAGRGQHGDGHFDIEIRNVETVESGPGIRLVRYEEWQGTGEGETGRISTACFRAAEDAPEGIVWTDLQETWLER